MSAAKAWCGGCLSATFGTNLSRLIWATVLHAGGIVLTVINLAIATDSPKEALSWARFDVEQSGTKARVNWGLLKFVGCIEDQCNTLGVDSIENGTNFIEGGRGTITACAFAMFFALLSIIILWLWIFGWADKLKVPRIVLSITNFLSLTLYIVAISTYYKLSYDRIGGIEWGKGSGVHAKGLMPGYAIAVGIVVIVMSFFAWGFSFWRVCRPNKNEPVREPKAPKVDKKKSTPEGEVPTSTTALETAKAQQAFEPNHDVEGQPGSTYESSSNGGYGGSGGAYGGSYGGAYGNGNNYSADDNSSSAYGNSNSSYGNSAYGNSGGAYSAKESAYGY